jgi:hypothetical protein
MPAVIGLGSFGDDVKRLQRVLAHMLPWNPFGPITGIFDDGLETSVKGRRRCWPTTSANLPPYREVSPTLRAGCEGPAVA